MLSTSLDNFFSSHNPSVDNSNTTFPLIPDFKLLMLSGLLSAVPQSSHTRLALYHNWKDWRWGVGNKISSAHQMEQTGKTYTWNLPLLSGVWIPKWQTAFLQDSFAITPSLSWRKPRAGHWEKGEIPFPSALCPRPDTQISTKHQLLPVGLKKGTGKVAGPTTRLSWSAKEEVWHMIKAKNKT